MKKADLSFVRTASAIDDLPITTGHPDSHHAPLQCHAYAHRCPVGFQWIWGDIFFFDALQMDRRKRLRYRGGSGRRDGRHLFRSVACGLVRAIHRCRADGLARGTVRRYRRRWLRAHRAREHGQRDSRVPRGFRLGRVLSCRADVAGRANERRGTQFLVSSLCYVSDDRSWRLPCACGLRDSLLAPVARQCALHCRRPVRDRIPYVRNLRPSLAARARVARSGTMVAKHRRDRPYARYLSNCYHRVGRQCLLRLDDVPNVSRTRNSRTSEQLLWPLHGIGRDDALAALEACNQHPRRNRHESVARYDGASRRFDVRDAVPRVVSIGCGSVARYRVRTGLSDCAVASYQRLRCRAPSRRADLVRRVVLYRCIRLSVGRRLGVGSHWQRRIADAHRSVWPDGVGANGPARQAASRDTFRKGVRDVGFGNSPCRLNSRSAARLPAIKNVNAMTSTCGAEGKIIANGGKIDFLILPHFLNVTQCALSVVSLRL